jgi:anti-anti-sigma factor
VELMTDEFTVEVDRPRRLLRVSGEIDIESADAFAAAVEDALSADGDAPLTVEMADVTFMDSSGLSVLVGASRAGVTVVLRSPSLAVRRLVEVSGLNDVLRLDP